jgi:formyl-CoA transferase
VPELKTDSRFQKRDVRKANRKALTPLLEARLREKPTAHWVERLNEKGVPSGEILDLLSALTQPQIRHRGTIQTVTEPGIGELRLFGLAALFSRTRGGLQTPPPRLGAHNEPIYGALGYGQEALNALKHKGVI